MSDTGTINIFSIIAKCIKSFVKEFEPKTEDDDLKNALESYNRSHARKPIYFMDK